MSQEQKNNNHKLKNVNKELSRERIGPKKKIVARTENVNIPADNAKNASVLYRDFFFFSARTNCTHPDVP